MHKESNLSARSTMFTAPGCRVALQVAGFGCVSVVSNKDCNDHNM
jgi:hypothetical protein